MADAGAYRKPLPRRTEENAPFLDGLKKGEVRLQRCAGCGRPRYPASRFCPGCLGNRAEWVTVSGRGHVYSFIIVHQLYDRGFAEDIPYNVAVVELEEGPRLVTNITHCPNQALRIGMPVIADFVAATPDTTLLKFRRAPSTSA